MNKIKELLSGTSVFLIGMMGTGKTTIGQSLAKELDYRFFDTDVLSERIAGKSINEIFATEGEAYFRELESRVLEQVCAYTQSAIATGGGIILEQHNWSYLHHGLIIWLDAPVEILTQRLAKDTTRPLLQEQDLAEKLSHLLAERRSRYAQADLRIAIDSSDRTPADIVAEICDRIPSVVK